MKVREIFYSLQGEGVYQGLPMVFIRLAGCNLIPHCSYCDTSYSWNATDGKEWTIEAILEEVSRLSPHYKSWVCITGGEPLWQLEELELLVRELKTGGYLVTIETNGSFKPPRWYTIADSWNADMKCPSSGVCGTSSETWFRTREQDQIKFVVGNLGDLDFAKKMIKKHLSNSPQILVSPIAGKEGKWSKEWLQEVAKFCLEMRVRYSLQIHKLIWGNKRGV